MRIVIPGGSGQVGTILARAFTADKHEVVVLSRRPVAACLAFCRLGAPLTNDSHRWHVRGTGEQRGRSP